MVFLPLYIFVQHCYGLSHKILIQHGEVVDLHLNVTVAVASLLSVCRSRAVSRLSQLVVTTVAVLLAVNGRSVSSANDWSDLSVSADL